MCLPAACGSWKETKAAYRRFDSDRVTAPALLEPHYHCTRERMMAHRTGIEHPGYDRDRLDRKK
ncbi:MAG: transposase DNA-binding-containing protein [Candidatus Methylomirabilales bacterium]